MTKPQTEIVAGLMVRPTETDNQMDARITGELVLTDGDCLAVGSGDDVWVVAWPHGTELLDDDRIGVTVPC